MNDADREAFCALIKLSLATLENQLVIMAVLPLICENPDMAKLVQLLLERQVYEAMPKTLEGTGIKVKLRRSAPTDTGDGQPEAN